MTGANSDKWRVIVPQKNETELDPKTQFYLLRDAAIEKIPTGTETLGTIDDGKADIGKVWATSPIEVETKAPHGLKTLDRVKITWTSGPGSAEYFVIVLDEEGKTIVSGPDPKSKKVLLMNHQAIAGTHEAGSGTWRLLKGHVKPFVAFEPLEEKTPLDLYAKQNEPIKITDGVSTDTARGSYIFIDKVTKILSAAGLSRVITKGKITTLHWDSLGNGEYTSGGTVTFKKNDGPQMSAPIKGATNASPIVVTLKDKTAEDKTASNALMKILEDGDHVEIEGVAGNTAANGDLWTVLREEGSPSFALLTDRRSTDFKKTETAISDQATAWRWVHPFEEVFEPFSDDLNEDEPKKYLSSQPKSDAPVQWKDPTKFQVLWGGIVDIEDSETPCHKNRQAKTKMLYELEKQFKFLFPSQLYPKLAAVLITSEKEKASDFTLQRTALFGDSAPATKGKPGIRVNPMKTKTYEFLFKIEKNKDEVTVTLRNLTSKTAADLYLLKYLVTGTVVYDQCRITSANEPGTTNCRDSGATP
ncbi:hypothetical protein ACFL2Q_10230 [Thermodesulfobacteriota bacterium]